MRLISGIATLEIRACILKVLQVLKSASDMLIFAKSDFSLGTRSSRPIWRSFIHSGRL
jgi:hypothetical protein